MATEPRVARSIRLDPRTWAALERLAARDKRSVNNLIEVVLDTHIDVQEAWPE